MQSAPLTQTSVHHPSANGGAHGIVSSGHFGRLKYASPQDLPSYPSIGLKKDGDAASAAASLGWESQKPLQLWKPDRSASASAAAFLAKDYKMAPSWEPQKSTAGSKAAVLAAESAGRHAKHQSSPPSLWGSSAAAQAFKSGQHTTQTSDSAGIARRGSLYAAKGAMAGSRPRSRSSPTATKPPRPDQAGAAASAVSAAAIAHRPSTRPATAPPGEAGAVPYTTMSPQMFTSHPPVQPELDEQKRNDILHASAVAMAKRMYNQQQRGVDTARGAHGETSRPGASGNINQPTQFTNLQEAAYRLAQERLAKLHEEHQKEREFREYYGSSVPQRKFTIRGKLRRRSSSDGDIIEDRRRSQQIRQQMSLFSNKLSEVDEQKRQRDREALLAAAQRNVKARLQGMDEKLYAETGKVAPSLLGEWELKAHAAAQARSELRKNENAGKVDIGGGRFMDRKAVDEIAARRVRPVLDEINERAEKERERQAALRLEEESRKGAIEKKRAREKEIQEVHRKLKEQQREEDRVRAAELKQQEKTKKGEEKAAKAEQKRLAKEEKRKPRETQPESPGSQQQEPGEPESEVPAAKKTLHTPRLQTKRKEATTAQPAETSPTPKSPVSDADASSPSSKVKTWWRKFSRPRGKSASGEGTEPGVDAENGAPKKSFIGGAALAQLDGGNNSSTSVENRSASMREVALAGRARDFRADERGESSAAAVAVSGGGGAEPEGDEASPVSSLSSDDKFVEARDELDSQPGSFATPSKFRGSVTTAEQSTGSPAKESRFLERFE